MISRQSYWTKDNKLFARTITMTGLTNETTYRGELKYNELLEMYLFYPSFATHGLTEDLLEEIMFKINQLKKNE